MQFSITQIGALLAAALLAGTAQAASVGVCGGGGGSQSKTLSCPAGQYVVGVFQRHDWYTDRIGIRCAGFNASGARGALGAFQYAGGNSGSQSDSDTCSGNRAVIGIFTKAGGYVDRVHTVTCEKRGPQGFVVPRGKNASEFFELQSTGFPGGSPCDLSCPNGEAIHRLIVRYGSWIDSIEAFCRP